MTTEPTTEKTVRVVAVSNATISVTEARNSQKRFTFSTRKAHKYLPKAGNFCIIERWADGWTILRRTLAPQNLR